MRALVFLLAFVLSGFALELKELDFLKKERFASEFKLTKKLNGFERALLSFGFLELKDGVLFYEIKKPIYSLIKIDKNGVFVQGEEGFEPLEGAYDKGLFLALLNLDLDELSKNFSLNLSGDKNAWVLTLTPSNVWLAKIFTYIKLEGGKKLSKIILLEKNKDLSLYELL